MNKTNIQHLHSIVQGTKEGIYTMKGINLTKLLHNLIREYGKYCDGSYAIDPLHFLLVDKKLILSYVTDDVEEYEWACETPNRIEVVFNEYLPLIQKLLDSECEEVYAENMEEMGMVRFNHSNNNESYWIRG